LDLALPSNLNRDSLRLLIERRNADATEGASGERRTGQDLFRSRLDQIIDPDQALVKLAGSIDWRFLEGRPGAVYTDKPGHPPLRRRG
jgi:hypothetical protein